MIVFQYKVNFVEDGEVTITFNENYDPTNASEYEYAYELELTSGGDMQEIQYVNSLADVLENVQADIAWNLEQLEKDGHELTPEQDGHINKQRV